MTYQSVEATWASNGRPLPTQAEREAVLAAMRDAAAVAAPNCIDADDLEGVIPNMLATNPDRHGLTGWGARDVSRVLADCCITVRA